MSWIQLAAVAALAFQTVPVAEPVEQQATPAERRAAIEREADAAREAHEEWLDTFHVRVCATFDAAETRHRDSEAPGAARELKFLRERRAEFLAKARLPNDRDFMAFRPELDAARDALVAELGRQATAARASAVRADDLSEALSADAAALKVEIEPQAWARLEVSAPGDDVPAEGAEPATPQEAAAPADPLVDPERLWTFEVPEHDAYRLRIELELAGGGEGSLLLPGAGGTAHRVPLAWTEGGRRRVQFSVRRAGVSVDYGCPREALARSESGAQDGRLGELAWTGDLRVLAVAAKRIAVPAAPEPRAAGARPARRAPAPAPAPAPEAGPRGSEAFVRGSQWKEGSQLWAVTARQGDVVTIERPWGPERPNARLVVVLRLTGTRLEVQSARVPGNKPPIHVFGATGDGTIEGTLLRFHLNLRYRIGDGQPKTLPMSIRARQETD